MSKQKLDHQTLEQEIQDGKTVKQIAHEYGYGYPSRQLSEKIWKLGYKKRNKMSFYESGGANVSLVSDVVEEACQENNIDLENDVFYETNVNNGTIEIEVKDRKLVKDK